MKLYLYCHWAKSKKKIYKYREIQDLVYLYRDRMNAHCTCVVTSNLSIIEKRSNQSQLWLCHTEKNLKPLSSDMVAAKLDLAMNQGVKAIIVAIGDSEGFKKAEIEAWKPEIMWSFGPLTLPHELASLIAMEQLYRGFSILNNQPYHLQH